MGLLEFGNDLGYLLEYLEERNRETFEDKARAYQEFEIFLQMF